MKAAIVAFSVSTSIWGAASIALTKTKLQEAECSYSDDPERFKWKAKCDSGVPCYDADSTEKWQKWEKTCTGLPLTYKWRREISYKSAKDEWDESDSAEAANCAAEKEQRDKNARESWKAHRKQERKNCKSWVSGESYVDEDDPAQDIAEEEEDSKPGQRKLNKKHGQVCSRSCACCSPGDNNPSWPSRGEAYCAHCGNAVNGKVPSTCFSYAEAGEQYDHEIIHSAEEFDSCLESIGGEGYQEFIAKKMAKKEKLLQEIEQVKSQHADGVGDVHDDDHEHATYDYVD